MKIFNKRETPFFCGENVIISGGSGDRKNKWQFECAVFGRRVRTTGLCLFTGACIAACSGKPADAVLISKDCWVDSINGQNSNIVQVRQEPLTIIGWAADSTTGRAPEKLALQILDKTGNVVYIYPIEKRSARPDVASVYKQPGYHKSGFDVVINSTKVDLMAGEYGVSIAMRRDSAVVVCESTKKILIKPD